MLPSDFDDLLTGANTAILVSLGPDGGPHASPVWFWFDGKQVLVSTTTDRQKFRNMTRDRRVAFTVFDPARPLRYLELRGVVTLSDDMEGVVRDEIARKHGFADGTAFDAPGARRVTATIVPVKVIEH